MSTNSTLLLDEYLSLISKVNPATSRIHQIAQDSINEADTLIVVDVQHDFLPGGAFGVAEGDSILDSTAKLIHLFASKGATVIATRDYHPINHCSFNTHGGPFPPHCIQGTKGSFLHETIGNALRTHIFCDSKGGHEHDDDDENAGEATKKTTKNRNVNVVFKAFSAGIDSFGAFEYSDEHAKARNLTYCASGRGHCSVDWTGGYYLFSSNQKNDINAPPDVMSVLDKKPLKDLLPSTASSSSMGRVFVCGLALDFCVIDTAVNYANYRSSTLTPTQPIFIFAAQTRAAHIPGFGKFGSGFLTNPEEIVEKMSNNGIVFGNVAAF